jgi:hypothetical protein
VYLVKDGTLFLFYGRKDFETMTDHKYEYVKGLISGVNHKRFTALLMSLVMLFPLSGCQIVDNVSKSIKDDPKNGEKEYAEQVFEYLKNEDIDSLCELFAPEVSVEHSLESEWKYFFDHVDGNIVSYKGLKYPGEGIGKDQDGEVYDSHISVNYSEVKTDNGTVYEEFGYYHVKVNRDDPDSVGLVLFTMQDPDTGNWITVGGEPD